MAAATTDSGSRKLTVTFVDGPLEESNRSDDVTTPRSVAVASAEDDVTIQSFVQGEGKLSIWTEVRSFLTIVGFITRLPVPTTVDIHPGFVMKGMAYMPAVGTLIGIPLASLLDVCHITLNLPIMISACIVTIASDLLTGCFHQDGLADSADGIGGGWTTLQILKIMSDSRVGTYGVAAYCLYTVTKIQLLAAHGASVWNCYYQQSMTSTNEQQLDLFAAISTGAGPAIIVSQALSRLTAPYLIRTHDYIDDSTGPKTAFYSFFVQAKYLCSWSRVLMAVLIGWTVTSTLYGPLVATLVVFAVLMLSQFAAGPTADFYLGGVMGDYLGATICATELLCLLLLLLLNPATTNLHQTLQDTVTMDNLISIWPLHELIQSRRDQKAIGLTQRLLHHALQHVRDPPQELVVLSRFLVVVAVLSIWCKMVGHPRVIYRDWPTPLEQEASDEQQTGTRGLQVTPSSSSSARPSPDLHPKAFAEAMLSLPASTYAERYHAVKAYVDTLCKPVGALGTLEDWAARLATMQRTLRPSADNAACLIFAADHGAAKSPEHGGESCSLYPPAVTQSILVGLQRGIAGASFLSKTNDVALRVVDVGVASEEPFPYTDQAGMVRSSPQKLVGGTRNLCVVPAMTMEQCERCMQIGRDEYAKLVKETKAKVVVLGEVGIGNTTASSALIAQATKAKVESVCGGGATTASESANAASIQKKVQLVKKALQTHGRAIKKVSKRGSPAKEALARLGGAEIAALVGAMLEAAKQGGVAILVDGFIVTAAALVATAMEPLACSRVMFLTTQSAEKGHVVAVAAIQQLIATRSALTDGVQGHTISSPPGLARPALNMNLRMGEGTAALLAVPLMRSAAAMFSMGTIEDILGGVPEGESEGSRDSTGSKIVAI